MAKLSLQQISSVISKVPVEPELYLSSHVLVNLHHITDSNQLHSTEASLFAMREYEIRSGFVTLPNSHDYHQLRLLHWYLFQDTYEWAGAVRAYPMAKNHDRFSDPEALEQNAANIFGEIHQDNFLHGCEDKETVAKKISHYLGQICMLHPFPEGNGRTQRVFLNQLLLNTPFVMQWDKIASWEMIICCQNVHRQLPCYEERYVAMDQMILKNLMVLQA